MRLVDVVQRGGLQAVSDFIGAQLVDLAPAQRARSAPPRAGQRVCLVDVAQRGGLQAVSISPARS